LPKWGSAQLLKNKEKSKIEKKQIRMSKMVADYLRLNLNDNCWEKKEPVLVVKSSANHFSRKIRFG